MTLQKMMEVKDSPVNVARYGWEWGSRGGGPCGHWPWSCAGTRMVHGRHSGSQSRLRSGGWCIPCPGLLPMGQPDLLFTLAHSSLAPRWWAPGSRSISHQVKVMTLADFIRGN